MTLYQALQAQQTDLRTACNVAVDILCSNPLPAGGDNGTHGSFGTATPQKYAYNDGDGSTAYDIDVPIQIHGFDPNFHFVSMTFNPEGFSDMKDKYFLLNGRSYPDTVGVPAGSVTGWTGGVPAGATNPDPVSNSISTAASDGMSRPSQPLPTLVTLKQGQKALLRIADLDVTEYQTLASIGIPMKLIGFNAKLLRDQAGNNLYVTTNSITLGGGESLDVILDSTGVPPGTYFLYTTNLDHLSNDAENFGGLMTEVVVN
jgi:FtsP/CotA-like multicopper oxidase with cupredoxin domain